MGQITSPNKAIMHIKFYRPLLFEMDVCVVLGWETIRGLRVRVSVPLRLASMTSFLCLYAWV